MSTAAALVAGCGSSSSKTSAGSASSSGATKQAHGTPIVIGNIGSYSGAEASSIGAAESAIKAWAASVNAKGGLNGHPIDLIVKDDGDSPATGIADARELLQQDHVVAIVGDWSDTDTAWAPTVEKAGIPLIGGGPSAPDSLTDTLYFPAQTSPLPSDYGLYYALKQGGATKVAIPYCAEVAQCALGVTLGKQFAPKLGMQITWSGAFSSSAPDLTPQCLAAKNSGADGVTPSAPSDSDIHFAEACYAQGWKPIYSSGGTQLTDKWLSIPAFNNLYGPEGDAPWFDNSTPALKEFHSAMAKYASGAPVNPAAIESWASGKLFEAAVSNSGSSTVTTASILNGLYNLHGETLGGIAPPLTFTRNQAANITCFFLVRIHNGTWTEPQGLRTSCEQ